MSPQIGSVALGLWLMAASTVLGYGDPAATNHWVVGPLVASIAFVAVWEVARALRWANAPGAVWLLVAPWILGNDGPVSAVNSVAVGAPLLVLMALPAPRRQRFGGGWRSLVREGARVSRPSSGDSDFFDALRRAFSGLMNHLHLSQHPCLPAPVRQPAA